MCTRRMSGIRASLAAVSVILGLFAVRGQAFDNDGDRDVDLTDFTHLFDCTTGPEPGGLSGACFTVDGDGDGDVDVLDFRLFQLCHRGPGVEAAGECQPLRVDIAAPAQVLVNFPTELGAALSNVNNGPSFEWALTDGTGLLEDETTQSPLVTAMATIPLTVTVVVHDSGSAWVAYDEMTVLVATEPLDPSVTIQTIPGTMVNEDTPLVLKAEGSDPLGLPIVEVSWSQTEGSVLQNPFSNPTAATTNFNTCCPGEYEVAATVRNAAGMLGKAFVVLTINDVAGPGTVSVNAGADRFLVPNQLDFGFVPPFSTAALLTSGVPGGVVPNLFAVATDTDFPDSEIALQWEVIEVPPGVMIDFVQLLNSSYLATGFFIIPEINYSTIALNPNGLPAEIGFIVAPGEYRFRVTATNPLGDQADDEVTFTIVPPFAIPATFGSLHGLTLRNGSLSNRVQRPSQVATEMTLLTRINGILGFRLRDAGDNTQAFAPIDLNGDGFPSASDLYSDYVGPQAMNSVPIASQDPPMLQDVDALGSSSSRGTFLLQAGLAAGPGSVSFGPAAGMPQVHVQPDLPSTLDIQPPAMGQSTNRFGLVNSTSQTTGTVPKVVAHGARSGAGFPSLWDGNAVTSCDINNDGFDEIITLAGDGIVSILRGHTNDPSLTTNSPVNNVVNNDGKLSAGVFANGFDVVDTLDFSATATLGVGAIACCDLDGDGNKDLVMGDLAFDAGGVAGPEGRVLIFYGTANLGFAQNPWTTTGAPGGGVVTPVVLTRPDINVYDFDVFGYSLACGNINGDTNASNNVPLDDLIVGCPGGGQASGASALTTNVVNAVDETLLTLIDLTGSASPIGTIQAGDLVVFDPPGNNILRRCTAVTATSITVDRAIGVNLDDADTVQLLQNATGAVFGFYGNIIRLANTTISDTGAGASFRIIPNASRPGDLLGSAVALGDISNDGMLDIVFGAPGRRDSAASPNLCAGAVFVTNGGNYSGAIATISRLFEGNSAYLGFGRELATLDFNGNNVSDIFVSAAVGAAPPATAALATATNGRAYFIPNTQGTIQTPPGGGGALDNLPRITGATTTTNLGARMAGGDLNGDGFDDALLLNPSATAANQQVLIINGSSAPPATLTASTTITHGAGTAFMRTPALVALFGFFGAPNAFVLGGVLYGLTDSCGYVDVNSDHVGDFFWQGLFTVSDGHVIYGRE